MLRITLPVQCPILKCLIANGFDNLAADIPQKDAILVGQLRYGRRRTQEFLRLTQLKFEGRQTGQLAAQLVQGVVEYAQSPAHLLVQNRTGLIYLTEVPKSEFHASHSMWAWRKARGGPYDWRAR